MIEEAAFEHWKATAFFVSFENVAVSSLAKPGPIWAAVRRQAAPPDNAPGVPIRFVAELMIGDARARPSSSLPDQIKPALDGVISAYHAHSADTQECSERLASAGLGEKLNLQRLLADPAWNVFGRRAVVRPFGAIGVQWNPADDLCVAATIESTPLDADHRDGPRWRLSGRLMIAEPI